jgi:hypothetical protein
MKWELWGESMVRIDGMNRWGESMVLCVENGVRGE